MKVLEELPTEYNLKGAVSKRERIGLDVEIVIFTLISRGFFRDGVIKLRKKDLT